MANQNKPMIDLPFFELCSQSPIAISALSSMTTVEAGDDRYMYLLASAAGFYRYDKIADTWQQLASPVIAPVTASTMRRTRRRGYHGRIIAATSTTVTIPGLRGPVLQGQTLQILQGTGLGQERVLTYVGETVHETGVITATTTSSLGDSTKKWRVNQWAGYMVGITFGADATQYKKILYNDTTTLYIADANLQPHDPWNNQIFVAVAPYAVPVTTAGAQAHFQIMSSTYSVPAWTTIPDYTSYFTALTGGIYLVSSAAAAPFFTCQYYDTLQDSWQTKTVPQSLILAALGTDFCIERTAKVGGSLATKVGAISGTNRTLSDAGQTLTVAQYNNCRLLITAGTGIGQNRRIINNTATTFTVARNWDINPDSTSEYEVWPDFDRVYLAGGAASAMYAYSPENDYWMQGQSFDDGITTNISCSMKGWNPIGVSSGTRIALGVQAINPVPTAGGTLYQIGEILTCSVGGTGAQAIVTSINPGGVVTGIALTNSGTATGFAVGAGRATTASASGTGCTIEITAVGPTANIVTATANWFAAGHQVTFAGCTDSLWNTTYTILGVSTTTTFSVAATAAASMAATASQTTAIMVDPTKNWIVNEHVGRLVHVMVAGTAPTSQIRWITANTATTLTYNVAVTAAGNGTSKYCIYDSKVFGTDDQRKEDSMVGFGQATGGSTTTLIDSTKTWVPNQYVGYMFRVEAGTGYGSGRIAITSNTANTLTFATQTFTPDDTTRYEIADAWGLPTAGAASTLTETTTKNWAVNQWAGKRVRITSGTLVGTETTCTANSATALTITGTPDATSTYALLAIPPRGAGTALVWTWGATSVPNKMNIYSPRGGGSNTMDIYNINKGKWTFGYFFSPQAELFTTGSSYAYDGTDSIYMSRSVASNPIRIFRYDITNNAFNGLATTTWSQNAVHVGNFLEIMDSPDGTLSYLYTIQNTGTLMSRALLF